MNRAAREKAARTQLLVSRVMVAVGVLVAAFLVYAGVVTFSTPRESRFDDTLPNPMGGPTAVAPGEASGLVTLAGLEIEGGDVQMGEVALDVTYVPGWEVTNTTDDQVRFVVGQPQVLEGCCPGPIYADGELTQAGQEFTVRPGGTVLLQFPLQMHAGMDGPHHLAVPLATGDEQAAVHVRGNFTADARA